MCPQIVNIDFTRISLTKHTYNIDYSNQDKEFVLACKRRVIQFVYR